MSDDPFSRGEPVVQSVAEGDFGTCPCGWRGIMHKGRRAAQQELDAHLRKHHPERAPR